MFVGSRRMDLDLTTMSILRAIFRPRINTDETQIRKIPEIRLQKSVKICVHLWLNPSFVWIALRKSQSRRAPMSRLPRPRPRNLESCPSKAAQDRHETPFGADRAARAIRQNNFVTLPLLRPAAGSSSDPKSTIEITRAGFPGLRGASLA